jgi:hypothetical protein
MTLDPHKHARRSDPDTSKEAAERLTGKRSMMRRLLIAYLGRDLTAEEATRAAGYGPADCAWKRVSDLKAVGYIEDTGVRRPGESGRRQAVLGITKTGRRALLDRSQYR